MRKVISLLTTLVIVSCFMISYTGCYYDKQVVPTACDTANMTYAKNIQSILVANCTTCHYAGNDASVGGGYNFEAYNAIRNMALNRKLLLAINHLPGAQPMPRNAPKLSDCDIAKFTNWVNHNAPQ
jgi:mono/diheme cytochrome c family protein